MNNDTIFDATMTVTILISDGNYTIGHVDGLAAQWEGNMKKLTPGDHFDWMHDGAYFGVQAQDEYRVNAERQWEETEA